MGELHKLPDVKRLEYEASEWIARLQADDVSAEDRARFEAWRSAHPAHAQAFERLMGTWRQFMAAGPLVRAVCFAQSVSESTDSYPRRRWPLAAAAVAIFAVILAALFFARAPAGQSFATAVGEQVTLSLSDGSKMHLNSNSVASVQYSAAARVIRLEKGEAFFDVAHDARRPFWVGSGKSWIRAVGTAFNVYVRPGGVQVIVSQGVVKVGYAESARSGAPPDSALSGVSTATLSAGQQADLLQSATSTRALSAEEVSRAVSWREGVLYFENQTLGDVVDAISRYTTMQLVIDDEQLRQLVVGGTFEANPQGAEALLVMLEQGFSLSVRREGGQAYIAPPL